MSSRWLSLVTRQELGPVTERKHTCTVSTAPTSSEDLVEATNKATFVSEVGIWADASALYWFHVAWWRSLPACALFLAISGYDDLRGICLDTSPSVAFINDGFFLRYPPPFGFQGDGNMDLVTVIAIPLNTAPN